MQTDTRGVSSRYSEMLAALIETETRMGEHAALLAEMADALSHFPDAARIGASHILLGDRKIEAAEWPSFRDLGLMLHTWREQRTRVDAMWDAMSVEERAGCNAPPVAAGVDVTRAWV
ncbi:MAG TPA: hypothetical protein PLN33_12725 [Hyphomonadaceae bacterium]|nr:hypothetical protein [Hyphomonadaceae bacterium]HPN06512.1 hypothetical protein [Hyphomonadaceae bacterium]